MRFMNGKKKSKKRRNTEEEEAEAENEEEEKPKHREKTREELVDKLKELKMGMGKDDEEFYSGVIGDSDDDEDYEDYSFSEDESDQE